MLFDALKSLAVVELAVIAAHHVFEHVGMDDHGVCPVPSSTLSAACGNIFSFFNVRLQDFGSYTLRVVLFGSTGNRLFWRGIFS
jgi:hypothetical protein